jgi:hypothetical protein
MLQLGSDKKEDCDTDTDGETEMIKRKEPPRPEIEEV